MIEVLGVADVVWTGLIVAVGSPTAALLIGRQLNKQRQAEKKEDYKRLDEVAEKAEKARVALIKENKRVADEAARQQAEVAAEAARQQQQVAEVAAGAAQLLADAQETTLARSDEVARRQDAKGGGGGGGGGGAAPAPTGRLLAIVISHPSGLRREIQLDAVPRCGDHILLRGAENRQPSKIVDVLFVEANGGLSPSVIVVVQPPAKGDELSLKEVKSIRAAGDE